MPSTPGPRSPARSVSGTAPLAAGGLGRVAAISGAVAVYLGCYWVVTRVTHARGPGVLFETATALDPLIPHLPATWPLYWIAYPFVLFGAGGALLRLSPPRFRRALVAVLAMTLTGAVIQLLVPARAPWPAAPAPMQVRFHESICSGESTRSSVSESTRRLKACPTDAPHGAGS